MKTAYSVEGFGRDYVYGAEGENLETLRQKNQIWTNLWRAQQHQRSNSVPGTGKSDFGDGQIFQVKGQRRIEKMKIIFIFSARLFLRVLECVFKQAPVLPGVKMPGGNFGIKGGNRWSVGRRFTRNM